MAFAAHYAPVGVPFALAAATTLPGQQNAPTATQRNLFAILASRRCPYIPTTARRKPFSGFDMSKQRQPFDLGPVDLSFDAAPVALDFADAGPARCSTIPASRRIVTRPRSRRTVDLRKMTDAAKRLLDPLPKPGNTVHALVGGEFQTVALLPAMVELVGPCSCVAATLGVNMASVDYILDMLADGRLTDFSLVASDYWLKADRAVAGQVLEKLHAHGCRAAITRSHAKLVLLAPTGRPDRYTLSGSGNLRSSMNVESLDASNDRALFDFHSQWLNELLNL